MGATACGKVILLGEHAVVYGRPALAAGLARGVEAEFVRQPGELALEVGPWGVRTTAREDTDLSRAFAALLAAMPWDRGPNAEGVVRATIRLPGGGGLGSSAALGVATARALAPVVTGRPLANDETLAAAFAWERVFHGNPSGIDHTVAAHGGAGVYSKAAGFQPVEVRAPLRLLVADTGERTSTREMVESVARQHARRPEATEQTFDAIASLVRNGALALTAGDGRGLGQLMDLNQALLASLLLSTERTERLCRAAREAGALGAKLTGGGGGGCIIALPGEHEAAVRTALEELGAPVFATELGPGVAR